jgi:hypothetical protein
VEETGQQVNANAAPLVFLTTNEERDLPPAFIRRCVELKLASPEPRQLIDIARAHFENAPARLLEELAAVVAPSAGGTAAANPPSTAEFLDTVRACLDLNVFPGSPLFDSLAKVTVWKHGRTAPQVSAT